MSKVMSIPDQRARAAMLHGWYQDANQIGGLVEVWWCEPDGMEGIPIVSIDDYTPDTNLQQADELKARMRELGWRYKHYWASHAGRFRFTIILPNGQVYVSESKLSEGAALLAAVAEIPMEGD